MHKLPTFHCGALETFSGPAIGTLSDIINLPLKARDAAMEGEIPQTAGDLLNLILQNTPYINLAYVRPALDVLFIESLRNWASPGYLHRRQRDRLKEYGQRSVLPVYRGIEQLLP
ncbi:hypothetical protein [Rhizobium leguminosarum]|uniref:hypothetical protein n=1 Tax=Rhizobium leguminosarum TaxID=384 RepID=UPI0013DB9491|nr:hypothetical protein [Rhizobium leguminosarum]NEK36299.1 hypothetical protein [Rhizobium leguminosarum]